MEESISSVKAWLEQTLPGYALTILGAVGTLLLGILILNLGRGIIRKTVSRRGLLRARSEAQSRTMQTLLSSLFDYAMYFVIAATVLSVFGVNVSSLITVAGVGGIAIGLGAQTFIKDVIGGVFLWLEGSMAVGDTVILGQYSGDVESIALRTTVIRNVNGDRIAIPNGDIRTVINQSRDFKVALVEIRCPYEADPARLKSVLQDEMNHAENSLNGLTGTPQVLGIVAFERDCVTYRISAPCQVKENWRIEREIRALAQARLAREGIPMPQAAVVPVSDTQK